MSPPSPPPGLIDEAARYRNSLVACATAGFTVLFLHHHGGRIAGLLPLAPEWGLVARFLVSGALLVLVPLLTAPLLRNTGAFGLRPGSWKGWLPGVLLLYGVALGLILLFGRGRPFTETYPLLPAARGSLGVFCLYAAARLFYLFGWEFLFRGYMLFSLRPETGGLPAVLVQTVPYAVLHAGKPELEAYASIPFGFLLGIMALRAKSLWPCLVLHGLIAISMDVLGLVVS